MALRALQINRGEFPRMADNLRRRLIELSAKNENLDEQLIQRVETLCEMKEAAIKRFDEILVEQEAFLAENLKE